MLHHRLTLVGVILAMSSTTVCSFRSVALLWFFRVLSTNSACAITARFRFKLPSFFLNLDFPRTTVRVRHLRSHRVRAASRRLVSRQWGIVLPRLPAQAAIGISSLPRRSICKGKDFLTGGFFS